MEDLKEVNTEQTILQCAEEVFIERGFDGAKTTEIARRAGVNHAMIHYYFRTKLNLFNVVFQDKLKLLATSFANSFTQDIPFLDKLKIATETHFDFVAQNPRLFFFLYTEVINSDERKMMVINNMESMIQELLVAIENDLEEEVSKGTMRKVKPLEILLNILSLNVTTFLALPIIEVLAEGNNELERFMDERKINNVETIISSLKINSPKPSYTQTSLNFGF